MAKNEFPLQNVVIHDDPKLRIDKYRENTLGTTSLHPATIKDAGGDIPAIAKITKSDNPEVRKNLVKTGTLHRSLDDNRFITKVLGIQEFDDRVILFLEKGLASVRDLNRSTPEMIALKKEVFATMSPKDLARDILHGLVYIHSNTIDVTDKISHRDIKPENLLLIRKVRDGSFDVKFSDFDSAKQLDVDASVDITTGVFSKAYLDPYLDLKKSKGQRVNWLEYLRGDVYSGGCVLYEVLAGGEYLFQGESAMETMLKVLKNDRSNLIKSDINELGKNLIYTMTQKDQADRITAVEAENHIFFCDDNYHIQALKSINEAILALDPRDPESQRIKDVLNESFFMVFKDEWQKLPFVVPDVLSHSNYSSLLEAFLRYSRNTMAHAEQHKASLTKHFGSAIAGPDMLNKMLASAPRGLIHFNWFAKRYLKHLPCTERFPEKCAAAYEELMAEEKKNISGGWEAMYARVCPKPKAVTAPVDEHAALEEAFEQSCKEFRKLLDQSESHFKNYKKAVKEWEMKKDRLQKAVENKRENHRLPAEIDEAQKKLDEHVETRLPLKWMLDAREYMRNPEKMRGSKIEFSYVRGQCNSIKIKLNAHCTIVMM